MTYKKNFKSMMNYEGYDEFPVVHFGFWRETIEKWQKEGHITAEEAERNSDALPSTDIIASKLGFDSSFVYSFGANPGLNPVFERKIIEEMPDGTQKIMDSHGAIILQSPDAGSIPAEVDHTLKDRASWEEHFLPRLQFSEERVSKEYLQKVKGETGDEYPFCVFCGSLAGVPRNWLGVQGISFLYYDDEELFREIIDTNANLVYKCLEKTLSLENNFDCALFWEDICFKNGPLIVPSVFDEVVGPYYKKITDLLSANGINIVALDCDGLIDSLIPTWMNNGVNTMFPIEVGTWNASIKPWREQYGKPLHGIGGMRKHAFAEDYAAIDAEIERLKPLVDLGGYIPCPDHRIAPDAKWENVQYYCEKIKKAFS